MKFILIDVDRIKTNYQIRKRNVDKTHIIHEMILNKDKICKLIRSKNSVLSRICCAVYMYGAKRRIIKLLRESKNNDATWQYILGNNILTQKGVESFVVNLIEKNGGKRFSAPSEMNENIHKYILDYSEEKQLVNHELKILLVCTNVANINLIMIKECINKYKKVNLYLIEKPSEMILNRISKINQDNGSSIEIIKYSKKAFLEYDVIYFIDDFRTNYPRMRINKSALVIDDNDAEHDKYNSNLLFLSANNIRVENHEELDDNYGALNVAAAIRKTVR